MSGGFSSYNTLASVRETCSSILRQHRMTSFKDSVVPMTTARRVLGSPTPTLHYFSQRLNCFNDNSLMCISHTRPVSKVAVWTDDGYECKPESCAVSSCPG